MVRIPLDGRSGGWSVAAVALLATAYGFAYVGSAERVTFTVRDKARDAHWNSEGRYRHRLLVISDDEVFEVDSSWTFLAFDKYERYRELKVGGTYDAVVAGWRIPPLSVYRNIIRILAEP
jgi:hypothetical protein